MSATYHETENLRTDDDGILWLRAKEQISEDDWDYVDMVELGDIRNNLTSFDVPDGFEDEYNEHMGQWNVYGC